MNEIVVRITEKLGIEIPQSSVAARDKILLRSRIITSVSDEMTEDMAQGARSDIKGMLKNVETTRKEVKAPLLVACETLDDIVTSFRNSLIQEDQRLEGLLKKREMEKREVARVAEVQRQRELARLAEEKRKVDEEALRVQAEKKRLEDEANAKLAAAKTDQEAIDAVQSQMEAAESMREQEQAIEQKQIAIATAPELPAVAIKRTEGARDLWIYEITDAALAYKAHPEFFELVEKKREINAALSAGLRACDGMKIHQDIKIAHTRNK